MAGLYVKYIRCKDTCKMERGIGEQPGETLGERDKQNRQVEA